MSSSQSAIRFVIGSRQIYAAKRRLTKVSLSLEQLLAGSVPSVDTLPADSDGYFFLSFPTADVAALLARFPGYRVAGRQEYARRYIAMDGTFEDYLGTFSGKTRSTLKRKNRKLAELSGGEIEVEEFTCATEMERFFAAALPLSNQTYQARLLGAGLPESAEFLAHSKRLAADDRLRAYLLRVEGKAVAYLYLPIEGETLVYAYLGYAPEWSHVSPGTVLQLAALERLFAEGRYRYFDFTEGDGAHKQMFSTGAASAASFYLLRPTLANKALATGLDLFDRTVGLAKTMAQKAGALATLRKVLRG